MQVLFHAAVASGSSRCNELSLSRLVCPPNNMHCIGLCFFVPAQGPFVLLPAPTDELS